MLSLRIVENNFEFLFIDISGNFYQRFSRRLQEACGRVPSYAVLCSKVRPYFNINSHGYDVQLQGLRNVFVREHVLFHGSAVRTKLAEEIDDNSLVFRLRPFQCGGVILGEEGGGLKIAAMAIIKRIIVLVLG